MLCYHLLTFHSVWMAYTHVGGDIWCDLRLLRVCSMLIWIVIISTIFMCLPIIAATLAGYP